MLSEQDLQSSVTVARRNWNNWRDVYEHAGSVATNPIFAEPGSRFKTFYEEYRVKRTIKSGKHDDFRRTLIRRLPAAVRDDTGRALDSLDQELHVDFGTHNPPRSIRSFLSKTAAFVKPERFVAWDQFARKGLNIISGHRPNMSFDSYADYIDLFEQAWNGDPGDRIRRYIRKNGAKSRIEGEARFQRRVLDVALMKCGGRKMS